MQFYIYRNLVIDIFQVGKLLTTPCVKFVAQAASYLFFLGLILIHGHVEQGKLCTTRVVDLGLPLHHLNSSSSSASRADNLSAADDDALKDIGRMCIRNHKPAIMEVCIVLWISGSYLRCIFELHSTVYNRNVSCVIHEEANFGA